MKVGIKDERDVFLFTYRFAARIAHIFDELLKIGRVLVDADALVGFLIIVAELMDFQMSIVSALSYLARGAWIGVKKPSHPWDKRKISPAPPGVKFPQTHSRLRLPFENHKGKNSSE